MQPGAAPMVLRRAALDSIREWLAGAGQFLLVTGSMGSGKSVLARQLVDALATMNIAGAEHFCEADNTATIAVSALLSSWSTRLCQQLPGYYEDLARDGGAHFTGVASGPESVGLMVVEARITVGEEPPADAFFRAVARPLRRLAAEDRLPPTVLMVDGVEEARDADGRNRILALLAGLTGTALPPGVRMVATSRPEHNVRVALEGADQLDLDAIGGHEVAELIAPRTTPRFAAELSDHVRGNFLLASVILDELAASGEPLIAASIPALPGTLPGIFRKRLWRLVDERDQQLLDVLGLLAIARAPLREPDIAALLGIEPHRVRASVHRILPVLAQEPARHHRLVHRALAEFLLDPDENPLPMRTAGSLHAAIADRMYGTWAGRWELCDERYPVHHLVAHLAMAPDGTATLARLLGDPGFLQAKAALAGVDELHADLTFATPRVPGARSLDEALLRQAHHLRDWDPRTFPGLFVQQLQHDATATGDERLSSVLSGHLDARGRAQLRLNWAHAAMSGYVTTLAGHRGTIRALAVDPDGTRVVTAADDGTARIWDLSTGLLIHTLAGHHGPVTCVAVSPDGNLAVTGAEDGTVRLWELHGGRFLRSFTGAEDVLTGVVFAADGSQVVAASWDRTVRVWSIHSGLELRAMRGHQGRITALAMNPDGNAQTWSADGTTRSWDLRTGRQWSRAESPTGDPWHGITETPDGSKVIIASGHTATVWWNQNERPGLAAHDGRINAMVLAADGQRLITGSYDGRARVWDARTGTPVGAVREGGDWVTALAASSDGTLAVTAGWEGEAQVWALPAGRRLHTLSGHRDTITSMALTGSLAVTASWDTTVRVWDLRTGQPLHTMLGHEDWVNEVALTPDGTLAVSASADGTARVWSVHTGQQRQVLPHRGPVTAVAVTPDGTRVVTAARDGNARVWDLRTGEQVRLLAGHEGAINAVDVAAERAVTGSDDGTAVVWDLRRGEAEHTIEGHRGPVTSVAAGALVTTVSADTIQVWSPETTLYAGLSGLITCLSVRLPQITVATASGALYSYLVVDHGRRTRATPKGRSASLPDGS